MEKRMETFVHYKNKRILTRMTSQSNKAFLQDLACSSTPIEKTLILKLVAKKDATQNQGQPTFQSYTFMDEQGTRRRAGAFGKQITFLNKLLVLGQAYEVTKPIYRDVLVQYSMYPREKKLILSSSTIIKLLKPSPDYQILLFQYFVISETIQLTAWKSYAHECQTLPDWDTTAAIIVFNDVRTVVYDGKIILSTSFGSQIDLNSEYERPIALRIWAEANKDMLPKRKMSIEDVQTHTHQIDTYTLAEALNMDPSSTQADTNIRVLASIISFGSNSPRTSVSCPKCFTKFYGKTSDKQMCTNCPDSTLYTTKMFIDFTIEEGDNKTELAAMTKTSEKLLNIKAVDFHNMSDTERDSFTSNALESLRQKRIPLILTPNPTHLINGDMEWELKYIEGN